MSTFSRNVQKVKDSFSAIKTALAGRGVTVPSDAKLSDVPHLMESIENVRICLITRTSLDGDDYSAEETVSGPVYLANRCLNDTKADTIRIYFSTLPSGEAPTVASIEHMFDGCVSLVVVDFSNADVAVWDDVTSMSSLFQGCSSLSGVDINTLSVSHVTDVSYMCSGCTSLETLYFDGYSSGCYTVAPTITNCSHMFEGCQSLVAVSLVYDSYLSVTDCSYMFAGCTSLPSAPMAMLGKSVESEPINAASMYADCSSIDEVEFEPGACKMLGNAESMFNGCSALRSMVLPEYWGMAIGNAASMLSRCSSLETLDIPDYCGVAMYNSDYMFDGCSKLSALTFGKGFGQSIEKARYMFRGCSSLTDLTFPEANTSGDFETADFGAMITDSEGMFWQCSNLTTITLPKTFGAKITNSKDMFYFCSSLENVTSPFEMHVSLSFVTCTKLTEASIKNILASLKAPDSSDPKPTLKLSGASYKIYESLDDSCKADALANGWTITQ